MWLAYILVFQNDKPILNICCVVPQALIMIAVAGMAEPMIEISENFMQLFNEFSVLLISYHLFPLTDFVYDLETRNMIG